MLAVLRLGHRPMRDKRITTHVCLTARAFGAEKVILHGRDPALVATVRGVVDRFGGPFEVEEDPRSWKRIVEGWPGGVAHLTMYGQPYQEVLPELRAAADAAGPAGGDARAGGGASGAPEATRASGAGEVRDVGEGARGGLLLVVGAEKVPGDLYRLAQWNVAVGSQPHSEVAALAVLLHALRPDALDAPRRGGAVRIEPALRGKRVRAGDAPAQRPAG